MSNISSLTELPATEGHTCFRKMVTLRRPAHEALQCDVEGKCMHSRGSSSCQELQRQGHGLLRGRVPVLCDRLHLERICVGHLPREKVTQCREVSTPTQCVRTAALRNQNILEFVGDLRELDADVGNVFLRKRQKLLT